MLEEEALITTGDRVALNETRQPDMVLLSRIYPSVSASASSNESSEPESDDGVPPSQNQAESFPFLDYDRSRWQVPCPYCDALVNNTKDAFVTHWANANRCSGPGPVPPQAIHQITQPEWNNILDTIESRTTAEPSSQADTHSTSNNGEQPRQAQQPSVDLDIENPDGSFPWLHYPDKGWKVPCPYCDDSVFNSEEAFRNHWSDSERCHGPVDRELEELTMSVDGAENSNSRQSGMQSNQGLNRLEQLTILFENHLSRDDSSDHWINLTFENGGQMDTHYQYLYGVHTLTRLDSLQKTALEEAVDQYDLTIDTEADNYAAVMSNSQQPDVEANLCVSLLRTVYNTQIEDVKQAAEHGDGYEAW
jgi:endogenous inhibitor of DNA gyrase (YacG/DUF329 family)